MRAEDLALALGGLDESFIAPAAADMLNDAYLGFSAVALGLIIWLVYIIIKNPKQLSTGK